MAEQDKSEKTPFDVLKQFRNLCAGVEKRITWRYYFTPYSMHTEVMKLIISCEASGIFPSDRDADSSCGIPWTIKFVPVGNGGDNVNLSLRFHYLGKTVNCHPDRIWMSGDIYPMQSGHHHDGVKLLHDLQECFQDSIIRSFLQAMIPDVASLGNEAEKLINNKIQEAGRDLSDLYKRTLSHFFNACMRETENERVRRSVNNKITFVQEELFKVRVSLARKQLECPEEISKLLEISAQLDPTRIWWDVPVSTNQKIV
ncbi:MAG: hypothetical protein HYT98_00330 [Candidatus Sungbacteria bacterium]|nr:hypothetical protein [Candidatus Sungbacteria bacterium]